MIHCATFAVLSLNKILRVRLYYNSVLNYETIYTILFNVCKIIIKNKLIHFYIHSLSFVDTLASAIAFIKHAVEFNAIVYILSIAKMPTEFTNK